MDNYAIEVLEEKIKVMKRKLRFRGFSSIQLKEIRGYISQLQNSLSLLLGTGIVAEGVVKAYPSGIEIGDKTLSKVNDDIINRCGKNIIVSIKEVE